MQTNILSSLPEEIFFYIVLHTTIPDVLSLKQTCRSLHALVDSDYLWHELLSSDGISSSVDPRKLSGGTLQRLAVKALRLDANWSRKAPRIRAISPVLHGSSEGSFDDMRFLPGATILVAVRRNRRMERPTVTISVFSIPNVRDAYKSASFDIPGYLTCFDVSLDDNNRTLVFAASIRNNGKESLEVYRVPLPDIVVLARLCNSSHDMPFRVVLEGTGGFYKVALHGGIVAASVVNLSEDISVNASKIMLANWRTGYCHTISPHFLQPMARVEIKLFPSHLVVVAAYHDKLNVHITPSDFCLYDGHTDKSALGADIQTSSQDLPIRTWTVSLPGSLEICISDSINYSLHKSPSSLSFLAFPSNLDPELGSGKAALIRLVVQPQEHETATHGAEEWTSFPVLGGSYPVFVQLGTTGRRAVWLQQSLSSDSVQLMKLDYRLIGKGGPLVDVLIPRDPELPFKPSYCRALAFDEATGRLCIGLFNGELYVLDYA